MTTPAESQSILDTKTKTKCKWVPLVSDPELFEDYAKNIGGPPNVKFHDVLSTEDWALEMIGGKPLGLVLLFPLKPSIEDRTKKEDEQLSSSDIQKQLPSKVWFTKQTVGNACGTVGLLHVFGNCQEILAEGKALRCFYEKVRDMTPDDRAKALETDKSIAFAHRGIANRGPGKPATEHDEVAHHFVAFVQVDNHLIELDGRRKVPINRGSTSTQGFLKDAARLVKREFMDKDPGEVGYSMMAVTES